MDKRYLINYLRLSKGDVERRDESNSITNQRRIQDEYIKNHTASDICQTGIC